MHITNRCQAYTRGGNIREAVRFSKSKFNIPLVLINDSSLASFLSETILGPWNERASPDQFAFAARDPKPGPSAEKEPQFPKTGARSLQGFIGGQGEDKKTFNPRREFAGKQPRRDKGARGKNCEDLWSNIPWLRRPVTRASGRITREGGRLPRGRSRGQDAR